MRRQLWTFLCLHPPMLIHLLHQPLVLDHLLFRLTGIKIFLSVSIPFPLVSSNCGKTIKMTYAPYLRSKTDDCAFYLRSKIGDFETFLPSKLTWLSSCSLTFLHRLCSHFLDIVDYLVFYFCFGFLDVVICFCF